MLEVRTSENIAAQTDVAESITPEAGRSFLIHKFCGSAAFSSCAVVMLVWCYDHATEPEQIIWSIKGEAAMPTPIQIDNADGVRKLAIVLRNGFDSTVTLSGYFEIEYLT